MNITQETDYALRVIAYLSTLEPGTIEKANSISEKEKVPERFLFKILRKLRKAGIVKSYMGVNGGYSLNKDPKEISVKDVIEAIDGPIYLNRCLNDPKMCNKNASDICLVHRALGDVQLRLLEELDNINFKEMGSK